jgi:hypothetical protein
MTIDGSRVSGGGAESYRLHSRCDGSGRAAQTRTKGNMIVRALLELSVSRSKTGHKSSQARLRSLLYCHARG